MKKIFLADSCSFSHAENRMKSEGLVNNARKEFFDNRFSNLDFLLSQRYEWMNDYLFEGCRSIEIGAGAGFSQLYLKPPVKLTDCVMHPHIEMECDALNMDLPAESYDVIVASHNIHHFSSPYRFFLEVERCLVRGGYLLIVEINTCLMMRLILRLARHEGYDYEVDVFNPEEICNDEHDPFSANCAIPELLFHDTSRFEKEFQQLEVIRDELTECFTFPLSGGVIAKCKVPELPKWFLKICNAFDKILIAMAPSVFAMGRRVVIRKKV